MVLSELQDDTLAIRRLSTVHLCSQLKVQVNRCGRETRTGRSDLKFSTSGGMVHPARVSVDFDRLPLPASEIKL